MVLFPMVIVMDGRGFRELVTSPPSQDMSKSALIALLAINGVAYSCYNLFSFLVLSRTDLVSHFAAMHKSEIQGKSVCVLCCRYVRN